MKHLIICRELPPAPLAPGGIGTYVQRIARLLADCGETVHLIGQLWQGAPRSIEESCRGRLIIHRVPLRASPTFHNTKTRSSPEELNALFESSFSAQSFSWQAGLLAEKLVKEECIDIIEAQEWEAPLYYFQLRRALGLGPKIHIPCVVHLHSPTEFIARHNEWDLGRPALLTTKRLEDYSLGAADAWLCPSRYMARQAEAHYGMAENSVRVIPLPIGDGTLLERTRETWDHGTICYVGRLERRKGIAEWMRAAVSIARRYPEARFEFIGAAMGGESFVDCTVPPDLQPQFIFHGVQPREALAGFLRGARIAVVPSRWENFPNTCVEAMASGLPVIASREGGMREMVTDGRTGWLADRPDSEGLVLALERALETPSEQLAQMGAWASSDIHALCDNKSVLERQLDFRDEVSKGGVRRSHFLPANLPWARRPLSDTSRRRASSPDSKDGIGIVVLTAGDRMNLFDCVQSIERQARKPGAVIVVKDRATPDAAWQRLPEGWVIVESDTIEDHVACKNAGIEALLERAPGCSGLAFLRGDEKLHPQFIATCESILRACPEVGLISCWASQRHSHEKVWIRPCPSLPYQWVGNDAAPFSVVRTEALTEAGNFRPVMKLGYEDWDLFNAVLAAGWFAVTVPQILVEQTQREDLALPLRNSRTHGRMREELLGRFPDLIARDAQDIVSFVPSSSLGMLRREVASLERQLDDLRRIGRNPYLATRWILKKACHRIGTFIPPWLSRVVSDMRVRIP